MMKISILKLINCTALVGSEISIVVLSTNQLTHPNSYATKVESSDNAINISTQSSSGISINDSINLPSQSSGSTKIKILGDSDSNSGSSSPTTGVGTSTGKDSTNLEIGGGNFQNFLDEEKFVAPKDENATKIDSDFDFNLSQMFYQFSSRSTYPLSYSRKATLHNKIKKVIFPKGFNGVLGNEIFLKSSFNDKEPYNSSTDVSQGKNSAYFSMDDFTWNWADYYKNYIFMSSPAYYPVYDYYVLGSGTKSNNFGLCENSVNFAPDWTLNASQNVTYIDINVFYHKDGKENYLFTNYDEFYNEAITSPASEVFTKKERRFLQTGLLKTIPYVYFFTMPTKDGVFLFLGNENPSDTITTTTCQAGFYGLKNFLSLTNLDVMNNKLNFEVNKSLIDTPEAHEVWKNLVSNKLTYKLFYSLEKSKNVWVNYVKEFTVTNTSQTFSIPVFPNENGKYRVKLNRIQTDGANNDDFLILGNQQEKNFFVNETGNENLVILN